MIYLDNAASTAVDKQVIEEMIPYLGQQYGNPSSIHRYGRTASRAVRQARRRIAGLVNAEPSEILLTSGGTESNNTALYGAVGAATPAPTPTTTATAAGTAVAENDAKKQDGDGRSPHVITTVIEHDAVLEPCRRLEETGVRVSYLPVDRHGMVDPDDLRSEIVPQTCLASVMLANNEVGTIQPVRELARICRGKNVLFHTDAVQAVGKIPVDVRDLGVDLLSISSHKLNGPKGAGALYVRSGVDITPLLRGGGQEGGLRSGTENVAGVVGFGRACMMHGQDLPANTARLAGMQRRLVSAAMSSIPHCALNGHPDLRIPGNAHLTFLGVGGEDLIIKLDEYGVAASTGSACSVNTQKASHVLQAMGLSHDQISGSLRLTLGIHNTDQDVDGAVKALQRAVSELREVSPLREKYGLLGGKPRHSS